MPTRLFRSLLLSVLTLLPASLLPARLLAQAQLVWTDVTPGDLATQNYVEGVNSIDFGNGTFVALGLRQNFAVGNPSPAFVYTSPDGVAWTRHDLNLGNAETRGRVRFADGRFYFSTYGELTASQLYSSADGVNWSPGASLGKQTGSLVDLAQGNGLYVMGRQSTLSGSPQPAVSGDLTHWTAHDLPGAPQDSGFPFAVFVNGHFVVAGSPLPPFPLAFTSTDGAGWAVSNVAPAGNGFRWLTAGNGVAMLASGYHDIQISADGLNWTVASPGLQITGPYGDTASFTPNLVRFVNDRFIAGIIAGDHVTSIHASADGQNWTRLGSLPKLNGVSDFAFGNGRYVAVSPDGIFSVSASAVTPVPGKGTQLHGTVNDAKDALNKKGTRRVISGHFTLTNAGTQAARNVQASIFLSDDDKFNSPDDRYLGSVSLADAGYPKLGKNGKSTGAIPFKFSYQSVIVGPTGGKYVLVVIDPQQFLNELDRTDNVLVFGPLP